MSDLAQYSKSILAPLPSGSKSIKEVSYILDYVI